MMHASTRGRYAPPRWSALLGLALLASTALPAQGQDLAVQTLEDRVRITVDGELFTDYIIRGQAKPILYPLHGPHGMPMTRNYPMRRVEGEATDHPHQQSVWFTHESVNGISFWHLGDNRGQVVHDELLHASAEGSRAVVASRNRWVGPDDRVHLIDETRIAFEVNERGRIIDYQVTLIASEGDVTFGDAKDALFGVRMHPNLRLRPHPAAGVHEVFGQVVNSEGVTGLAVWPKRARWIAYWGPIADQQVTFALFDHPTNLQYPTRWHARAYGLVSANPFGVHSLEARDEPSGEVTLRQGERMTFLYRILLLDGPADAQELDALHERFQEQPLIQIDE